MLVLVQVALKALMAYVSTFSPLMYSVGLLKENDNLCFEVCFKLSISVRSK